MWGEVNLQVCSSSTELGVSPDPCANQYPGVGPFTEPEVRAVADYVSRNDVIAYLAYHSCSQYYMIPYGFSESLPPDYDELVCVYLNFLQSEFFVIFIAIHISVTFAKLLLKLTKR